MKLNRLPEIGDRILVDGLPGTVISMAECKALAPMLFGQYDPVTTSYPPDETIRAWKYDTLCDGYAASFCIMRFRDESHPLGAHYNINVEFAQ